MSKQCPKCGHVPFSHTANFCYKDGERLIRGNVCECGHEFNNLTDRFCEACGKPRELATEKVSA